MFSPDETQIKTLFSDLRYYLHLDLEILTSYCDPLKCTLSSPRFIFSNQMEEFISIQRVEVVSFSICIGQDKQKKLSVKF